MTEISRKDRKEAKTAKDVMLSISEFIPSAVSWNISLIETFSIKRSFAYAQDDATEMCGAGKAERAERSGLPRFFFGYFLCSDDKESDNKTLWMMTTILWLEHY